MIGGSDDQKMGHLRLLIVVLSIWSIGCTSGEKEFLAEGIGTTIPDGRLADSMPEPDPMGIEFGSSAGECVGYCIREFAL